MVLGVIVAECWTDPSNTPSLADGLVIRLIYHLNRAPSKLIDDENLTVLTI